MMVRDRSLGDDVLRWASELGSGRWADLSQAIAHCVSARGIRNLRTWFVASDLADLGHLDVDWGDGRWSIASPVLALSPGMGMCAHLAGWRTSGLLERLESCAEDLGVHTFEVGQQHLATAIFAKVQSVDQLEKIAEAVGAPVVYDPSSALVDFVSLGLAERMPAARPPVDEPLAWFNPVSLTWEAADRPDLDGVYRFEMHGRYVFRHVEQGEWFIADRAEGQLRSLAGRDDVIRWHVPSRDGRVPRGMSVAREVSLPALAERAAVAASGFLPRRLGDRRTYSNVSRANAAAIAERLGLRLGISNEPMES